jgi:transposase
MNQERLQQNRQLVDGKIIIGIDPAKSRHQASVIGPDGVQIGPSFSFAVNAEGFRRSLWRNIAKSLAECNTRQVVFAVETSCNLWQVLAFYLHVEMGYTVVLVSPLSTYHERPTLNLDFSRTDPKDAFLVASLARKGAFTVYEQFPSHSNALHDLSITYDKLRGDLAQNRSRLRAHIERLFPEFLQLLEPDTNTARYLLKKYLFPDEFLAMNLDEEATAIEHLSRRQYRRATLVQLQRLARTSIGIVRSSQERLADRLTLDSWIACIETTEGQREAVRRQLVRWAQELPSYAILTSLSGVGETLGALFLANVRDLDRYTHFKQLEKLAGANLRLSQSGRYVGSRHISHIGNRRLLWVLYKMTEETAKRVPEIRLKYLKRQIKRRKHRKNIIAAIPQLLQLIVALNKAKRPYEPRQETLAEVERLEQRYRTIKSQYSCAPRKPLRVRRVSASTSLATDRASHT